MKKTYYSLDYWIVDTDEKFGSVHLTIAGLREEARSFVRSIADKGFEPVDVRHGFYKSGGAFRAFKYHSDEPVGTYGCNIWIVLPECLFA